MMTISNVRMTTYLPVETTATLFMVRAIGPERIIIIYLYYFFNRNVDQLYEVEEC